MSEQMIDFDPPATGEHDADVQQDAALNRIASLNAKAVMPDGRIMTREEILVKLGLNPNTPYTGWLNIIACGSNASALLPSDLQRVAVNRLTHASDVLKKVQNLGSTTLQLGDAGSGFTHGGKAPS